MVTNAKAGAKTALWIAGAVVVGVIALLSYSITLDDCTRVIANGCSLEWAAVLYLVQLGISLIFFGIPGIALLWAALFPICVWLTSPAAPRSPY